jgi:DNA-binding ferritin-like protein (Dps family)
MTLDVSGNLLVNASSQFNSGKVCVQDNLSVSNLVALKSTVSWVTGTYYLVGVNSSGSFIGGINQASQTTLNYATSSDERLKDNIVDAPSALESIENIRIRSFDWKEDGIHQKFGVVAQEVLSIVPEAVSVGRNEEDMMGVDYSKFVPRLIKAIQEQQAMIDELKAKVAALEAA